MSESRESYWVRWGGVAGILTPILAFTFISLAILTYPEFSWVDNALSDLGVVPGVTSTLFNFGLFASGLFSLNFAVGLYKLSKNVLGKIGAIIFFLAGMALEGIAVANENVRPFHFAFSVAFFVLMPIALLVFYGHFLKTSQKRLGVFTWLVAGVAFLPWVLQFTVLNFSGVAIPEAISAAAGSVWTLVLSYKMLKESVQAKNS